MLRHSRSPWSTGSRLPCSRPGQEAATVHSRQLGVGRFSAWLVEEGELPSDPLLGLKAPKLDSKVTEPLTEDQIKALYQGVRRNGPAGASRRGDRAAHGRDRGAGGGVCQHRDGRRRPPSRDCRRAAWQGWQGPRGAVWATDRPCPSPVPERTRAAHRLAATPPLWLGDRGKDFSSDALHKALGYHAKLAGISGFHPHLLRHTACAPLARHRRMSRAGSWLSPGGPSRTAHAVHPRLERPSVPLSRRGISTWATYDTPSAVPICPNDTRVVHYIQ